MRLRLVTGEGVRANDSGIHPGESAFLPVLIAMAFFVAQVATSGRYGYFRDEFYYLACGRHLDWGYVDHPPLVALLCRWIEATMGSSLLAIRILPAAAGGLTVWLTARIAREMGGGAWAQAVAALCAMIAPGYLFLFHILSMNAFDILLWTWIVLILAKILRGEDPKWWIVLGIAAGIGLMNKWSVLMLGAGTAAGLMLTQARRHFSRAWLWIGGAIALLIFLPHLLWQQSNNWPSLEWMRIAREEKISPLGAAAFLREQLLLMNPAAAPVWGIGLASLLAGPESKPFRPIAWIWITVLAILIASGGKPYYMIAAYPGLLAAGGVAIERFTRRAPSTRLRRLPLRAAVLASLLGLGLPVVPMGLPILSQEGFIRLTGALGVRIESGERGPTGSLPQHYADMHGWDELVAEVARVYFNLPPDERRRCAIFASNYGEAGSIDLLGKGLGLPPAISGHNSYWHWGPRGATGEVMIVVERDGEDLPELFEEVTQAGTVRSRYAMPYENGVPVFLCRRMRRPLDSSWSLTRNYN